MIQNRLLNSRNLKLKLFDILNQTDFDITKEFINEYDTKLISPLFSATYNSNDLIRWNSITAFGFLAEFLEQRDLEKLRSIIRKCIWMLTEESGGIAWMAPAIIGEILSVSAFMADEFSDILFSYIYEIENEPENFLDHPPLRNSALWGIQRLLQNRPEKIIGKEYIITQRLELEKEPKLIANLLLILKYTKLVNGKNFIESHLENNIQVINYFNSTLVSTTISEIAMDTFQYYDN